MNSWDERYQSNDTPWTAHSCFMQIIETVADLCPTGSSILEIGCGYAQEAIALAKRDYHVTALDVSDVAIERAKRLAEDEQVDIHFLTQNIMQATSMSKFDVLLDIAVLHTFQEVSVRKQFVQKIAEHLLPEHYWLNISCLYPDCIAVGQSNNVKPPPGLTTEEIKIAIEPEFKIVSQHELRYRIDRDDELIEFPALLSVMQRLSNGSSSV